MNAVRTIPLVREIRLPSQSGIPFVADLDGNGRSEFLLLQSPGLFHARSHGAPANRGWDHFCLTALDGEGKILWRVGKPWPEKEPYASHAAERSVCVFDLDGDGLPEVYVIRGDKILVLSARDGSLLREFQLPRDNFVILRAGTGNATRLLVAPSEESEGAYLFLSLGGETVFERDIFGAGHDSQSVDLDGDGLDEWLAGYEVLDHDLATLWKFEPCPPGEYNVEMHVDGLDLHWPQDERQRRIAYAGSIFVYVTDSHGRLVWEKKLVHPQQVIYASLCPDRKGPQLFVLNKRDSLQLFDFDGREIWTILPQENWPQGKPDGLKNKFHMLEPCLRLKGVAEGGLDTVCYLEGGWPYALNGDGRRTIEFACPPSSRQRVGAASYRRPDDYGWGYLAKVYWDGTAQKMIVADRDHLWLYRL